MEIINKVKYRIEKKEEDPNQNDSKKALTNIKVQLDWIKRMLEYATFSSSYYLRFNLKQGEIYEIDWGVNVNAEFSHRHFGVVLQDSNEFNPLVLVCPIKTNKFGGNKKSDLDLGIIDGIGGDDDLKSLAIINQIRTIDKMRIYSKNIINGNSDIKDKEPIVLSKNKIDLIITAYTNLIRS